MTKKTEVRLVKLEDVKRAMANIVSEYKKSLNYMPKEGTGNENYDMLCNLRPIYNDSTALEDYFYMMKMWNKSRIYI